MRYKVWVQIEEIDDDAGTFENASVPICILDCDDYERAENVLVGLTLQFDQGFDDNELAEFFRRRFAPELVAD